MIPTFAKATAVAAVMALGLPASAQQQSLENPGSAFADNTSGKNWNGEVKRTERGHLIGKPDADVELIEFVSYTCGHCATFAAEGEPAIDLALLIPGKMNLEVRPVIRNALDLTVSMLVACGEPSGFKDRHRDFMFSQSTWLSKARQAPQSQQAIWLRGDTNGRLNAARALDLDDKLVARGMSIADVNACLQDDAAAQVLIDNSNADRSEFGVPGTPSFALDGELLKDVHQWTTLYPVLSAKFAEGTPADQRMSGGN